jgi:ubiquinone/menaquinone biosynthesis C-methylase UbiE
VIGVESTNYAKFESRNPLVRRLIDRFYATVRSVVEPLNPDSVLDAGCGEGETLARLAGCLPRHVFGVDIRPDSLEFARRRLPSLEASLQSVYELEFEDEAFDLVLCLEVLEHLERPERALSELCRVSRSDLVLSVPHEPWFRAGSLLRARHLARLGNHPEHLQNWTRRGFAEFLAPRVETVALTTSFPWLIAHCRPLSPS